MDPSGAVFLSRFMSGVGRTSSTSSSAAAEADLLGTLKPALSRSSEEVILRPIWPPQTHEYTAMSFGGGAQAMQPTRRSGETKAISSASGPDLAQSVLPILKIRHQIFLGLAEGNQQNVQDFTQP